MIISASRRTDIPAYYSEWFFRRIKEGFVCVRNPMNPRRVSRVFLSPDAVDGIVFWTKNPTPMLSRLSVLSDYAYYFQFTLTPYGTDVENNLPPKNEVIIPAFQKLSEETGKDRVVWRYDPVLVSEKYTVRYHTEAFCRLCERLAAYTEKCTISFLDIYKGMQNCISPLGIRPPNTEEIFELAEYFSRIGTEHGISIDTCSESVDLGSFGIGRASCIDGRRLERICGYKLKAERDRNQRSECGCVSSVDIGAYNSCLNGCVYCYANYSKGILNSNCAKHDPNSPLLIGELTAEDIVKTREAISLRESQTSLF